MPRRKRAVGEGSKSGIKKKEDLGWQVQKDKRRKGLRKGSKDGGKAAKNIGGGVDGKTETRMVQKEERKE